MTTRYAVQFVTEQGRPINRLMWMTSLRQRKVTGLGLVPSYKVTANPALAQTWATRETAEKWAAHFSKFPDLYEFAAVEVDR